jgi:hypothetical protein
MYCSPACCTRAFRARQKAAKLQGLQNEDHDIALEAQGPVHLPQNDVGGPTAAVVLGATERAAACMVCLGPVADGETVCSDADCAKIAAGLNPTPGSEPVTGSVLVSNSRHR